jgi:hypothetical protein
MSRSKVCICCWNDLPLAAFSQVQPCDKCAALDPAKLNRDQQDLHRHAAHVRLNHLVNMIPAPKACA